MANKGVKNYFKVNVDLTKEREKCTFNPLELTHLLDGGAEQTQKRKEQESYFLDDPDLLDCDSLAYLSSKEKFEEVLRKMLVLKKRGKQGLVEYKRIVGSIVDYSIFRDAVPLNVHYGMFIPAIELLGTEEQKAKWLQRAITCEILGTYAQTEMGHGTFIRGIETTATYDPNTEEFVLNSPTLTSYKWWPAALGNTCNYAVVMAQLYSLGKCHGVHMFIVQLRDEETHESLPGIEVGDVGARLGLLGANNGYLALKNVRIPRENMLMKNSKIYIDGSYTRSVNDKLTYAIMVEIRVLVVKMTSDYVKKCVTIATRYSAVRRQSELKSGAPECQIIDYLTQQHKVFPQISTCLAFHYSAAWLSNLHKQVIEEVKAGNLNQLPEIHALSSCLKAVTSSDAAHAVETLRLACGGHGYAMYSGFPISYGMVTVLCTYEGENTVLLLQTARFLMKSWSNVLKKESLSPIVEYIRTVNHLQKMPFGKSIDWIVGVLERISIRTIETAWNRMNSKIKQEVSPEDAWNMTSIELITAAEIYARTFIVRTYREVTLQVAETTSQPLKKVLLQLLNLYGVNTILNLRGHLTFSDTNSGTLDSLQDWLVELLGDIRQNAVGIVDGFDLRDEILGSALGAYDGNVYERLFEEASKSTLNRESAKKSFDLYLKPFFKSKF